MSASVTVAVGGLGLVFAVIQVIPPRMSCGCVLVEEDRMGVVAGWSSGARRRYARRSAVVLSVRGRGGSCRLAGHGGQGGWLQRYVADGESGSSGRGCGVA